MRGLAMLGSLTISLMTVAPKVWAEESRTPVSMYIMNFAGGTLEYGYAISGGCQTHTTEFQVSFEPVNQHTINIRITAEDVTPAPDMCEAMISVQGKVDLKKLTADEASRQQVDLDQYIWSNVILPAAQLD